MPSIRPSRALALCIVTILCGCKDDPAGSGAGAGGTANDGGAADPASGDAGGGGGGTGTPPGSVTLGSDLGQMPTSAWRCSDGFPIQINPSFPQPFYQAGAGSCTVLTFLPPSGPSPGSGRAISATIRVGEETGQMRFVRMRILYQNGTGPKCCSLEQYGDPFTPAANTTSTVALGFPMTEEEIPPATDTTTTVANDIVALEVLSPTTPIPGYWPSNGGAVPNIANYLWLPALSAAQTPAPSNALLTYTAGFSGFVPLFSIAYAPGG